MGRIDASDKARGETRYVADLKGPGVVHIAAARSTVAHGRIVSIDTSAAEKADGVVLVLTGADLGGKLTGRGIQDLRVLAIDKVRFVGERVAAVAAETREQAERAAALVEVIYDELPAATTIEAALSPDAPAIHDAPWEYENSATSPEDGPNVQVVNRQGSLAEAEAAIAGAAHRVDVTYRTPAVHQGYLEPHACYAEAKPDGGVSIWLTNKSPYRLRQQVAKFLELPTEQVEIEPIPIGGDFGGKGAPVEAILCALVAQRTGRPAKTVLRYGEDLTAENPRHPSKIRVRLGSDAEGRLLGAIAEAIYDGGAYAGYKPGALAGVNASTDAYRLPACYLSSTIAYTNTVPKGYMRAPGAPQATFAFECALDELAEAVGVSGAQLRRLNLLRTGEKSVLGGHWLEHRGEEVLDAAARAEVRAQPPDGWLYGTGLAMYCRQTPARGGTSLKLVPKPDGGVRAEVPQPESGTGSHTVVRELVAAELGLAPSEVEVVQVSTDEELPDQGLGGSKHTAAIAMAVDQAAKAWRDRVAEVSVKVTVEASGGPTVGSYVVQVAQVAVDPETGELKVLEILSACDVAAIVNPAAHQMQIDGGTVTGFGTACLEDLDEADGQVWAANLGEYKLASARDVPRLRTVLVEGGKGVGTANVKAIGEHTNVATAAALANAVSAAIGRRVRQLPLSAEAIYNLLREGARG